MIFCVCREKGLTEICHLSFEELIYRKNVGKKGHLLTSVFYVNAHRKQFLKISQLKGPVVKLLKEMIILNFLILISWLIF